MLASTTRERLTSGAASTTKLRRPKYASPSTREAARPINRSIWAVANGGARSRESRPHRDESTPTVHLRIPIRTRRPTSQSSDRVHRGTSDGRSATGRFQARGLSSARWVVLPGGRPDRIAARLHRWRRWALSRCGVTTGPHSGPPEGSAGVTHDERLCPRISAPITLSVETTVCRRLVVWTE